MSPEKQNAPLLAVVSFRGLIQVDNVLNSKP